MKLRRHWNNNHGSTLILVIVCMLFVGIIASLILVYTSDNLQRIRNSADSSGNFYTAENVVDEVKTNLDELSDQAVRKAYTQWLQLYTTTSADQQDTLFKKLFTTELESLIESQFLHTLSTDSSKLLYKFDSSDVKWLKTPYIEVNAAGTQLTLKDLSIAYKDSQGFTSEITTDLVFNLTYPGFQSNTVQGMNTAAADYIIIADEQITNDITITGTIKGNLYGGGYNPLETSTNKYNKDGILIDSNSTLAIFADQILSRSTIKIADRSSVDLKGGNGEYDYTGTLSYSNVWARNLLLTGTSSQADPVNLSIQGNCYLADDLTLDANASRFKLKGTYYGYSTNNAYLGTADANGVSLVSGTPEGSSSIVLNASDAQLDLTGATKIWIAGKSFVSVPERYGLGTSPNNLSFVQGESITYRGLQASYLLPGDCIMGIGHNPMTADEYARLTTDPSHNYVDISVSRRNGGIRLEEYVNRTKPFRVANVVYNGTTTMVYLYLNFQSSDMATKYFTEFMTNNEELVNSRMTPFGIGSILFNPAVLENTGNILGYSAGKASLTPGKYSMSDPTIENQQIELSSKYFGLVTSLNEDYSGGNMNGFLTDYIVNMSKISSDTQNVIDLGYTANSASYKLITGKDVIISTNSAGIIIAKGDVMIRNGASFTGLIIARGKAIIQGNVNLKADPDNISYLIQNNTTVAPYFSIGGSGTTAKGNNIYSSDLINITYDNWRKN
jgi:hypothetical protein